MAQVDVLIPAGHHSSAHDRGYGLDFISNRIAVSSSPVGITIAHRYVPSSVDDLTGASSLPTPPPEEQPPAAVTDEYPSTLPVVDVPGLPKIWAGAPSDLIRSRILQAAFDAEMDEVDAERAFFVADLSKVYSQFTRWRRCLPEIEPFYGS